MIRPTVLPGNERPAQLKPQSKIQPGEVDEAVVKWRNTPFQERLDLLVDGKQPDWITNAGARINWLKRQLEEDGRGEAPRDELSAVNAPAIPELRAMGRPETTGAPASVSLETVAAQLSARALTQRLEALDLGEKPAAS